MPHFDHFPPPEEIDPYDVIVMSTSGPDDICLKEDLVYYYSPKSGDFVRCHRFLTENCER